jgi:hypothetical protein
MIRLKLFLATATLAAVSTLACAADNTYKLALVDHPGQLIWSSEGFKVIEFSAKPNGHEMGIRAQDASGHLTALGFLFLVPEQAPLTSAKCRDGVMGPEKTQNASLKILESTEIARPGGQPVAVVSYTTNGGGKTAYMVRGFIATGDLCGDLEFYSETPIHAGDPDLKQLLASYQLQDKYAPRFTDIFFYGQILYQKHKYADAAPIFEKALGHVNDLPDATLKTMKRVATDQAGIAYGISGNSVKARAVFEKAIVEDPEYPLFYYNLACADAEEKNLAAAKKHLQQAFDRKANIIPGETMPDPTTDNSFTPYRDNKEFWAFVEGLRGQR